MRMLIIFFMPFSLYSFDLTLESSLPFVGSSMTTAANGLLVSVQEFSWLNWRQLCLRSYLNLYCDCLTEWPIRYLHT